jgi:hypothetical protein
MLCDEMSLDRRFDSLVFGAEAWMPGLATQLVDAIWDDPELNLGPENYGSWRWLNRGCRATRVDLGYFTPHGGIAIPIERLSAAASARYEALGLIFRDRALADNDIALLNDAFVRLEVGADLHRTVRILVRSVHLLNANEGYDISHSEPALPFSIFVSLPNRERHATLRLAESILHEAMHLQLSLIEKREPLTNNNTATGYSPWQNVERPIAGLVHGLYVFTVIDQWLARVSTTTRMDCDDVKYVERRRREIATEISALDELGSSPALTIFGRRLVDYLLHCTGSMQHV